MTSHKAWWFTLPLGTLWCLVNALMYTSKISWHQWLCCMRIVHRIDRILLVCDLLKNWPGPALALADELKDKKSLRKYWAVYMAISNDRRWLRLRLARSEKDRKKQADLQPRKTCSNTFQVLERFGDYTLVEVTAGDLGGHIQIHVSTWLISAISSQH